MKQLKTIGKALRLHKQTMPILSRVFLQPVAPRTTLATISDLEVTVQQTVNFGVSEAICIELAQLPDSIESLKILEGNKVLVNGSRTLDFISDEEYPLLIKPIVGEIINCQSQLKEVAYSMSKDPTRFNLCGVNVLPDRIQSTDGHRLAERMIAKNAITDTFIHTFKNRIIFRSAFVNLINKLKIAGTISICKTPDKQGWVLFESPNISIWSRLIDGEFPECSSAMPKNGWNPNLEVEFERESLLSALKEFKSFIKNDKDYGIKFECNEVAKLSYSNSEDGNLVKTIPCETKNTEVLGMNAKYLLEAVQVLYSKKILMERNSAIEPVNITDANREIKNVIMPIRLASLKN